LSWDFAGAATSELIFSDVWVRKTIRQLSRWPHRDVPPMPRDELVDEGPTGRQCRHCRFFVAVHSGGCNLDIRCEAPFRLG